MGFTSHTSHLLREGSGCLCCLSSNVSTVIVTYIVGTANEYGRVATAHTVLVLVHLAVLMHLLPSFLCTLEDHDCFGALDTVYLPLLSYKFLRQLRTAK